MPLSPGNTGKVHPASFVWKCTRNRRGLLPEMQKNDAPGIKAIRMADGFPFRTVERNRIKTIKK